MMYEQGKYERKEQVFEVKTSKELEEKGVAPSKKC